MRFSAIALPSIIAQFPAPINTLFRVSMDLDAMQDDRFDPVSILEKLYTVNVLEWLELLPSSRLPIVDPILALQSVSDFYTEVEEAAELIGRLMIIKVERLANPHVCVPPITISTTEHIRLASTLLIIKIYYQLRPRFLKQGEYAGQLAPFYWKNLTPWLMDQGTTLDWLLLRCSGEYEHSLCHWDQSESELLMCLSESRFVRSYHVLYHQELASTFRIIPRFSHNLNGQHPGIRGPGYWHHEPSDVGHPAMSAQLRNHVSSCSDPTLQSVPQAHTGRYANICRQIGLYFWDYSRLNVWGLADPVELIAAVDACPGLSQVAMRYNDTPEWDIGIRQREAAVERTKQRQIIEWTRCPVQCSLEEWLRQKTALQRL